MFFSIESTDLFREITHHVTMIVQVIMTGESLKSKIEGRTI